MILNGFNLKLIKSDNKMICRTISSKNLISYLLNNLLIIALVDCLLIANVLCKSLTIFLLIVSLFLWIYFHFISFSDEIFR